MTSIDADADAASEVTEPKKHQHDEKKPSYYAVIFTSTLTGQDLEGYQTVGQHLDELALQQEGCLGVESARNSTNGSSLGITVSYWSTLESIQAWKRHAEHAVVQKRGRSVWYQDYHVRVAKVEREYTFQRQEEERL
jgi:heme-degrading monooxygenase HmoA